MGVHGLTTFVDGNRHFLFDVKFKDSRLLVDGSSLYFHLYLKHGLDRHHGGDYDAFASLVLEFLSALQACNIEPYVVLDGGNFIILKSDLNLYFSSRYSLVLIVSFHSFQELTPATRSLAL